MRTSVPEYVTEDETVISVIDTPTERVTSPSEASEYVAKGSRVSFAQEQKATIHARDGTNKFRQSEASTSALYHY